MITHNFASSFILEMTRCMVSLLLEIRSYKKADLVRVTIDNVDARI